MSRWRLDHPRRAVWQVLQDLVGTQDPFPWWADLQVTGRTDDEIHVRARSWVGYRLHFRLHSLSTTQPRRIGLRSDGDLVGRADVELEADGDEACVVVITWDVEVTRGWMRMGAVVLRPLFVLMHAVVMRRGRRGLEAWLASRPSQDQGGRRHR
ncbi:hypothetical protein ACHAAC_06115 [Aeromicrobium sp. CF4.19]|uniref:hypothetical protein n=1 Tax=Aeromicrobium sp. CF4.19 TaxID=3373082 RepID=UPI003EE63DB9